MKKIDGRLADSTISALVKMLGDGQEISPLRRAYLLACVQELQARRSETERMAEAERLLRCWIQYECAEPDSATLWPYEATYNFLGLGSKVTDI